MDSESTKGTKEKKKSIKKGKKKLSNKRLQRIGILMERKKIDTYKTSDYFTSFNIPDFLQDSYLNGRGSDKISRFRDWQENLFREESWINNENYVIVIPTAGGKTIAADVATANLLSSDPKAKVIYTLPFISLANEKYSEYDEKFFKFQVRPFFQNVGGSEFYRGSIAICTFEKAHSLISTAISSGTIDTYKLFIIDEIHMIGEEGRGAAIEALIIKCLLLAHKPRIIGLTATLNKKDAQKISSWINGKCFFHPKRGQLLRSMVVYPDGSVYLSKQGDRDFLCKLKKTNSDVDYIFQIIKKRMLKQLSSESMIIFVNARKDTVALCSALSVLLESFYQEYDFPIDDDTMKKRMSLINDITNNSGDIDLQTKHFIRLGIMYHHAGLTLDDRKLVENAARNKVIRILVCTTTLSAGVNINDVGFVIVRNITRYDGKIIPMSQFVQMIGRAGRKKSGEAYILLNTGSENERNIINNYLNKELPSIESYLYSHGEFEKYFLQTLNLKLVSNQNDFIEKALFQHSENDCFIDKLRLNLLIDEDGTITQFGTATASSGLSIHECVQLRDDINQVQNDLCLDDEVHLLYLCVSPNTSKHIKPISYSSDIWQKIFSEHQHVIQLITGLNAREIDFLQALPYIHGNDGRNNAERDEKLDRILCAVILKDIINEVPLKNISRYYNVDGGTLQRIQNESATFASQVNRFCEIYKKDILSAALQKFRQRLNFAVRIDLIPLISLPSVNRENARKLVDMGIKTPLELDTYNHNSLLSILYPDYTLEDEPEHIKTLINKILDEASKYSDSLLKLEELESFALIEPK